MQCFAASGDVTGAASKTVFAVFATAARRPRLKQIIVGASGTPGDAAAKLALRLITADGTGSAGTALPRDPADGAAVCTVKANYTVEPTYGTGNLAEFALNQRATLVWDAPERGEPACVLGTSNGLGLQMVAGPAVAYNVTFVWDE